MTNDNPAPPAQMPMLAIEMTDELLIETLDMMASKLDEVIHDFSMQQGISITTRSRISRDMMVQRAALDRALTLARAYKEFQDKKNAPPGEIIGTA